MDRFDDTFSVAPTILCWFQIKHATFFPILNSILYYYIICILYYIVVYKIIVIDNFMGYGLEINGFFLLLT